MIKTGRDNASNRHEWVIRELARIPAGTRILDAGAGAQPYRKNCAHMHYVAQDFGAYDPAERHEGLQLDRFAYGKLDHTCDITAIPEPDGSFGAILCTEVIEHVPDPVAALREFARLLAPKGTLLLTAPFVSFTHMAPYHYCTGFSRYFYELYLARLGFSGITVEANGNWFDLLAQEVWRLPATTRRYVGTLASLPTWIPVATAIPLLAILRRMGAASTEFAAYGLHVRASRGDEPAPPLPLPMTP